VRGGLERSFLTGSASNSLLASWFARRPDVDLCNPPVVGLPILAREGGGRIEVLLEMLPLALGGRAVVVLRVGFTGNRLGD
jgi:hypothetical protein